MRVEAIQRKQYKLPPTYIHQILPKETLKQLNALKKKLKGEGEHVRKY